MLLILQKNFNVRNFLWLKGIYVYTLRFLVYIRFVFWRTKITHADAIIPVFVLVRFMI